MNQMVSNICQWYYHLKIKHKLIFVILVIMVTFLFFVFLGLNYVFNVYDEQIYRKSSQILFMSSKGFEEELQKIEEFSFRLSTDSEIQSLLAKLKTSVPIYEKHLIYQMMIDRLIQYSGDEQYIQSVHIFDLNEKEYAAGGNTSSIPKNEKLKIVKETAETSGENHWITLQNQNNVLVSARKIRSYKNLNLEPLGTLLIKIDLDHFVEKLPEDWGENERNIFITDGTNVFFSEQPMKQLDLKLFPAKNGQGYKIEKINHKRYFVTYFHSPYTNWTYWYMIPYNELFIRVRLIRYFLVVLFFVLFVTMAGFAVYFSKMVTDPIERLAGAMKQVQKGNFQTVDKFVPLELPKDEVGELYRDFTRMIQEIQRLIKENYEKQLLIKETEMKALQSQINPHFLYNTLESINWMAKANQQHSISNMVESLGFLLRNSISMKESLITIEKELEVVRHYIRIQKFRFEERLDFRIEVPDEVRQFKIPKFTIQPLIENAIKYALEPKIGPCQIILQAFEKDGDFYVVVKDNGPGMDGLSTVRHVHEGKGNGIGINNIEQRIKLFFGSDYGIMIQSQTGKGTKVIVRLPVHGEVKNHVQGSFGG